MWPDSGWHQYQSGPRAFRPPFGAGARPPSSSGATVRWRAAGRGSFVPGHPPRKKVLSISLIEPELRDFGHFCNQ